MEVRDTPTSTIVGVVEVVGAAAVVVLDGELDGGDPAEVLGVQRRRAARHLVACVPDAVVIAFSAGPSTSQHDEPAAHARSRRSPHAASGSTSV